MSAAVLFAKEGADESGRTIVCGSGIRKIRRGEKEWVKRVVYHGREGGWRSGKKKGPTPV